jgi:farnesyl-diphosphate farnesyltransferase
MKDLGHCYGMGLQRLNLLRDTRQDLALGRCYWPQEELAQVGLSPASLSQAVLNGDVARLNAMRPLIALWKDQARADLSQGVAYALAVRPWRLRWACALPALLGLRTLQMIEQAGVLSLTKTVKVPRLWVYGLMARLTLGGLRHNRLRDLALSLGATPADLQGHGDNGTMHP